MVEPKIVAPVSCYDAERPWNIWRKSDYWFPIMPRKICEFRSRKPEGRNFKFDGIAFLSGIIVEPEILARVSCYDTQRL